jgi:hypothetical protein
MDDAEAITLPGGFERDGAWQRTVWLRPLTGRDEALFTEPPGPGGQAARVTALLGRTLALDPGGSPAGADVARELTVGDREAALLHLRRITLGDRLSCLLVCPACGEKLDLDVQATDLLLPPYPHTRRLHHARLEDGGNRYEIRFRLPIGADQEQVAQLARRDPIAAAAVLIERCVEEVIAGAQPTGELPAVARRRLPGIMADLDPQAVVDLEASCPACAAAFLAPLDTAAFLGQEVALSRDDLFREVHLLALHYHWGESEILGLTRRRRRRYLTLLADAMPAVAAR